MMSSVATESASGSDQHPLPPTALGLSLLEIYFVRIYNAPLLFYKPVLFQQYLAGKLHGTLLRAIFALATLYVSTHPTPFPAARTDQLTRAPRFLNPRIANEYDTGGGSSELEILSAFHSSGLPWAKCALRDAMELAVDAPSLMVIQALECLQHYWFGIGLPHAGNLCLGKLPVSMTDSGLPVIAVSCLILTNLQHWPTVPANSLDTRREFSMKMVVPTFHLSRNLAVDASGLARPLRALSWSQNRISNHLGVRWLWCRFQPLFPIHHQAVRQLSTRRWMEIGLQSPCVLGQEPIALPSLQHA